MHIGIAGPIATSSIGHLLEDPVESLPPGYPGAPLLTTLIEELLGRGHLVSAFTTTVGMPVSSTKFKVAKGRGFALYYCSQRPRGFRPSSGHVGRALDAFRIERAALAMAFDYARPDVLHAHWSYEFGLAALACKVPSLITCHDAPHEIVRLMPTPYRFARYLMARRCLGHARHLTAVSPHIAKAIASYSRAEPAVIPNPIPLNVFDLAAHDTSDERPRKLAMVINGWSSLKNPSTAIRAFALLRRGYENLEFHLFGYDFQPGGKAEKWARAHGLSEGIVFHGPTKHTELLQQLRYADALVHPSITEGCPMAVAEAMALGVPVIGGRTSGGVPWVIGDSGILTDIKSDVCLAEAISGLLRNPGQRAALSRKARLRAHNTFSVSAVVDQYEDLYGGVLKAWGRRRLGS